MVVRPTRIVVRPATLDWSDHFNHARARFKFESTPSAIFRRS
ncbi:hypothetical protein GQ600_5393 [Phytophthora cactorum]|nr:hypothetical protein GQ600_5393 [Phytophthora cactorum]